jgi:nicotinamide riboside transporter PnuC
MWGFFMGLIFSKLISYIYNYQNKHYEKILLPIGIVLFHFFR